MHPQTAIIRRLAARALPAWPTTKSCTAHRLRKRLPPVLKSTRCPGSNTPPTAPAMRPSRALRLLGLFISSTSPTTVINSVGKYAGPQSWCHFLVSLFEKITTDVFALVSHISVLAHGRSSPPVLKSLDLDTDNWADLLMIFKLKERVMSGDIEQQVNTNSAEFKQGVEAGHSCRSLINSEETTNE
jgi:hypothetical protein